MAALPTAQPREKTPAFAGAKLRRRRSASGADL